MAETPHVVKADEAAAQGDAKKATAELKKAEKAGEVQDQDAVPADSSRTSSTGDPLPGPDATPQGNSTNAAKPVDPEGGSSATFDPDERERKLIARFCKISGYDSAMIDGVNVLRRTVITTNGGKYQLSKDGALRKLAGPDWPNFTQTDR